MARESTIQILYGGSTTGSPTDLSDGELAYAHGSKNLFIGANGDSTSVWVGAEILDEDTMSSDSDTALATQQSIKAYVDSSIGASAGVVSIEGLNGAVDLDANTGITFAVSGGDTITFSGTDATTAAKGVASFASADFSVSSGAVSLSDSVVKNITTDTSPMIISGHGFSILGGEGMDVTHTGTVITVDGEDASYSNKGIASYSSSYFSVLSGAVSLADSASGAVLGITGTANEIEVSRTNGTVTIGLPDDVTITGNLTVSGTVTTLDVNNVTIEDPLIELGKGNTGDALDLGFYAQYFDGGPRFAGLARNASVTDADGNAEFFLFTAASSKPSTTISDTPTLATIRAKITGGTYT